jgi:hypothetical protein
MASARLLKIMIPLRRPPRWKQLIAAVRASIRLSQYR